MAINTPSYDILPSVDVTQFRKLAHVLKPGVVRSTGFVNAGIPGTLVHALTSRYVDEALANSAVSGIVTTPDLAEGLLRRLDEPKSDAGRKNIAVLSADDPQQAFFRIHNTMIVEFGLRPSLSPKIHSDAMIDSAAHVDTHVCIGEGVQIEAGAVIGCGAIIEDGAYIGPGALVAVDGHFSKRFDGQLLRVRHAGGVHIGARSQVLAGAIVQRALHPGFTRIGSDCVIAPGVQIAHGVSIGDGSTLTGGAQVAGYTSIGKDVWIGPGAVIRNLTNIGDHARIEIGSVIASSVPERGHMTSLFALPRTRALRLMAKWEGR